ncbi:group I truncated hemoglobin [Colwellia ponticola]|uniref:Group 1 truncated hemoglobin n=1 Tax=Colwellia ponticola TaxID=2304625 RepID=A0A8H2JMR1_9GAMM|nr:group 1 truncated hemoglobin [Colwellia ponticola]TMM46974.1 group 1 truncated hemoglobin [Colwellia ponticola]
MTKPLFERLGGEVAVNAAVDIFYRKVLTDKSIAPFFNTVNMNNQMAKQKRFLTMAFGGPNNYSGNDMRKVHAPLIAKGLNESHFIAVVDHLVATLQELDVEQALIDEVMVIVASTHDDVLGL